MVDDEVKELFSVAHELITTRVGDMIQAIRDSPISWPSDGGDWQ